VCVLGGGGTAKQDTAHNQGGRGVLRTAGGRTAGIFFRASNRVRGRQGRGEVTGGSSEQWHQTAEDGAAGNSRGAKGSRLWGIVRMHLQWGAQQAAAGRQQHAVYPWVPISAQGVGVAAAAAGVGSHQDHPCAADHLVGPA
jgi:hypothetical protein